MARAGESTLIHLDTHLVCWLYNGESAQLSATARAAVESAVNLSISPIVELELHFLHEIGRFLDPPDEALRVMAEQFDLTISVTPFRQVTQAAYCLNWTRDPFDRLIAAHAIASNARLVTKDRLIRQHCPNALW
jgi:PIN domain nuclease of toxin-antitoxin system